MPTDGMSLDVLAAALRAIGFAGLFAASGAVLYLASFGDPPAPVLSHVRRLILRAAITAFVCLLLQQALEAARFVGDLSGVVDPGMQQLAWDSSGGLAQGVRLAGLLMVVVGMRGGGRTLALVGAVSAVLSFLLAGHTSVHPWRGLLAPLLALHLLIVAFWFGSLVPLYLVSREEMRAHAVNVLKRFSAIARIAVPVIAIAGVGIAVALAPRFSVLQQPYGQLLLLKVAAFAVLMGLAAYNKWRLVPALERGDVQSLGRLRRSIVGELVLIVGVLAVTAVLTLLFSPD